MHSGKIQESWKVKPGKTMQKKHVKTMKTTQTYIYIIIYIWFFLDVVPESSETTPMSYTLSSANDFFHQPFHVP